MVWKIWMQRLALIMIVLMWPMAMIFGQVKFSTEIKTEFREEEIYIINQSVGAFEENQKVGRIFYNKATYWLKLYQGRLFALLDLNNYFFNLHPRENVEGNAYLSKFPYLALIYFVWGLGSLTLKQLKKWWWVGVVVLILPIFNNFDGWDVVLYLPIMAIIYQGWKLIGVKKYGWLLALGVIVTSISEYLRIIFIR